MSSYQITNKGLRVTDLFAFFHLLRTAPSSLPPTYTLTPDSYTLPALFEFAHRDLTPHLRYPHDRCMLYRLLANNVSIEAISTNTHLRVLLWLTYYGYSIKLEAHDQPCFEECLDFIKKSKEMKREEVASALMDKAYWFIKSYIEYTGIMLPEEFWMAKLNKYAIIWHPEVQPLNPQKKYVSMWTYALIDCGKVLVQVPYPQRMGFIYTAKLLDLVYPLPTSASSASEAMSKGMRLNFYVPYRHSATVLLYEKLTSIGLVTPSPRLTKYLFTLSMGIYQYTIQIEDMAFVTGFEYMKKLFGIECQYRVFS